MRPTNQTPVTRPARRRAAFTLIELLVAIAILGILGTVVIRSIWSNVDEARQTGTKTKVNTVDDIVQQFRRKHNRLPEWPDEMLEPDPMNAGQPWLNEEDLVDAWGNQMVLKLGTRTGEFEIISYGADGQETGFELDLGMDRDISSKRPLIPVESDR